MGISSNVNVKELPSFHYNRASLVETAKSIAMDSVIEVFFLIFSFVMVYVAFLRYDIR